MNYQVHHEGKGLGEYPLEELARRRAAGQLTGKEYVWREGMAGWIPLDVILSNTSSVPPMLPSISSRRKRLNPTLVILLIVAALVMLGGMGLVSWRVTKSLRFDPDMLAQGGETSGNDTAPAKPWSLAISTNTSTTADVQARRREFRRRQYLEGYLERGRRDQPCDATAVRFIETWMARNFGDRPATNSESAENLGDALVAQSGCDDPLILTIAGITSIEVHEATRRLENAVAGFPSSKHKAYPRFYATVTLAFHLSDKPGRVVALDAAALKLFRESLDDGSLLTGDQAEIGDILVSGWGYNFFYRNRDAVRLAVSKAGNSFSWLAKVTDGEFHVMEAWKARGGGFADTVTEQGQAGFQTHLAAAHKSFASAWAERPEWPLAAARMEVVAMGESGLAEMQQWFYRALAAQIDHPEAWSNMRWGLRPRWHGDLNEMLAFGVMAVDSRRFDTDVPRKFFDVVADIESELKQPPGTHIYGRRDIWPHFQRMYEGYIAAQKDLESKRGWRAPYAVVSYFAGKYDVARSQFEAMNWDPPPASLGGYNKDLSLALLEVAARTSNEATKIDAAESVRTRGDVDDALHRYTDLAAVPGLDDRTRKFVGHRMASLDLERRLKLGDWVDLLPASKTDPNWVVSFGQLQRATNGILEVQSGGGGHMMFSRARVGDNFEVRGEFEVLRSSNGEFQAGLVMGVPDFSGNGWYALRMKRNGVEGEITVFSQGWGDSEIYQRATVSDKSNAFRFWCQDGMVSSELNGVEVLHEAKLPRAIRVAPDDYLLGVGAFNDMNETVIRYKNLQVRRLAPGQAGRSK